MRILTTIVLVSMALGALAAPAAAQDEKPINLSLFNPVQIYDETTDIKGIRFSVFYGKNANFTGFDFGLISLGQVTGDMTGVQWNVVNNVAGYSTGWQAAFLNYTEGGYYGLQSGWVNYDMGTGKGVQFGIVNVANQTSGLQLGLFNMAETMNGLQIGFINVIKQGGAFPVFPIVNWSF